MRSVLASFGSHPVTLWLIRHVVSPMDRLVVRLSGGRIPPPTSLLVPTLLLTTSGRRSGIERVTPLIYVRAGDSYVVGNARPAGERKNPWVLNLRLMDEAVIRIRGVSIKVAVDELGADDADLHWPQLVAVWPALDEFYKATGQRFVFLLEPVEQNGR
jgi:F420H(2)-dependent quinone reductase